MGCSQTSKRSARMTNMGIRALTNDTRRRIFSGMRILMIFSASLGLAAALLRTCFLACLEWAAAGEVERSGTICAMTWRFHWKRLQRAFQRKWNMRTLLHATIAREAAGSKAAA